MRPALKILPVFLALLLLSACDRYVEVRWNVEMSVLIEWGDMTMEGSSVGEVTATYDEISNSPGAIIQFKGEAVVVDFGGDDVAFVPWGANVPNQSGSRSTRLYYPSDFHPDWSSYRPKRTTADQISKTEFHRRIWSRYSKSTESVTVPEEFYPPILGFLDLDDRNSLFVAWRNGTYEARRTQPRIISMRLKVTSEKATIGKVASFLPWLSCQFRTVKTDSSEPVANNSANPIEPIVIEGAFISGLKCAPE